MIHQVKLNKEITPGIGVDWNIEHNCGIDYHQYYFYPDGFNKEDWLVIYNVDYIPLDNIISFLLDFATEDKSITGEFVKPHTQ